MSAALPPAHLHTRETLYLFQQRGGHAAKNALLPRHTQVPAGLNAQNQGNSLSQEVIFFPTVGETLLSSYQDMIYNVSWGPFDKIFLLS